MLLLRLSLIVLLVSNLAGCIVSTATTGAELYYNRNDLSQSLDNQNVSYQASTTMGKDPALKDETNISVATFQNMVLLTGQGPTAAQRQKAEKIATQYTAGRYVFNDIAVGEPLSTSQQTEDSWITTKIKSKIITSDGITPGNFKVVTENGTVYLLGAAPQDQIDKVVAIAQDTDGVQKVVKMVYTIYYGTG